MIHSIDSIRSVHHLHFSFVSENLVCRLARSSDSPKRAEKYKRLVQPAQVAEHCTCLRAAVQLDRPSSRLPTLVRRKTILISASPLGASVFVGSSLGVRRTVINAARQLHRKVIRKMSVEKMTRKDTCVFVDIAWIFCAATRKQRIVDSKILFLMIFYKLMERKK